MISISMKFVIIGGGFAGVKMAIELAKRGFKDITLVGESDLLTHPDILYARLGGHDTSASQLSIPEIISPYPGINLVLDTVVSIDKNEKVVSGKKNKLSYGKLILACGSIGGFSASNLSSKKSYSIKSVDTFRIDIHKALVNKDRRKDPLKIQVIGGGATGVSMVSYISSYLKSVVLAHDLPTDSSNVSLLESADRIMPSFSKTASKKVSDYLGNLGVKLIMKYSLSVGRSKTRKINSLADSADFIIWATGCEVNPLIEKNSEIFKLSEHGKVIVNDTLEAYPSIYAIGGIVANLHHDSISSAINDARFLAKYFWQKHHKKPTSTRSGQKNEMVAIPLGKNWAYTELDGMYAAGRTGAYFRKLKKLNIYNHFLPVKNAFHVMKTTNKNTAECPLCSKT